MTGLLHRMETLVFGEDPCDGIRCPVELAGKVTALVGVLVISVAVGGGVANYFLGGLL